MIASRFLVFPRFLERRSDDGTISRVPATFYAARRRGGVVDAHRGPPSSVFSLLYETRKLVERVIMLNGRAAGSRDYPFTLPSPRSLPRLVRVSLSLSSLSLSLFLRHRLVLPASLRLLAAGGPHAENRAISFTLRQHANSRIV